MLPFVLHKWLIVLRAFAASREIQQGPVSREGAKPRTQNIGLFRPRSTTHFDRDQSIFLLEDLSLYV